TRCGLRRLAGRGALQRLARARRRRRTNGVQNSATPAAELGTRGGGPGGELSPLGSATPRRTVFRVGSPCTVAQSFGQQKASTTPTAWPKLTQSLTQWDLWRGWNSQENQVVTINRKALKSPRGDQAEHHIPRRSRDGTIPLRPSRDRGHVRHPTPRGRAERQPRL